MARNAQYPTGKNASSGSTKVKDFSNSPYVLKKTAQAKEMLEKFPIASKKSN